MTKSASDFSTTWTSSFTLNNNLLVLDEIMLNNHLSLPVVVVVVTSAGVGHVHVHQVVLLRLYSNMSHTLIIGIRYLAIIEI